MRNGRFLNSGMRIGEVTIADRSRYNMGLRTSLPAGAGGCQILAMSFVALIREFDSKAANEMEPFWLGKGRDKKENAEDYTGELSFHWLC